jgi:hypothetical protein
MKKLMALTLAVAMVLACMPAVVMADAATVVAYGDAWANADLTDGILTNVTGGYSFAWSGGNSLSYNGTTPLTAETVVIPSSVNGVAITSVVKNPFGSGNTVKNVIFSEGITSIPKSCFSGYSNLETAVLPSTLAATGLGDESFRNCSKLASINIPASVTKIGGLTFQNCYALSELILPDGLTKLSATGALSGAGFSEIVVPAGITQVEKEVFKSCSNLQTIVFKGDITSLGADSFRMSTALKSITFEANTDAPTMNSTSPFRGTALTDCVVYYPAGVTAFEDPDYQAQWPSGVTFTPIAAAPVDPVITPDSGEAGEAGTTVVWGTAANVVASENGTDGEGNTIYSYESESGDAVEFGVQITDGEFAGFYPALGLKEGKFAIKFTGNAASDLLTQLYLKINGALQD